MTLLQSLQRTAVLGVMTLGLMSSGQASAQTAPAIDNAITVATQWAALADSNQVDRMWSSSGPVMQSNVTKDDWAKYLAALQNELGRVGNREWVQIIRLNNPANLPGGEYLNVVFSSRFAKAPTIEKVSLTNIGGKWIPVGYVVTRVENSPAPAATPAAGK